MLDDLLQNGGKTSLTVWLLLLSLSFLRSSTLKWFYFKLSRSLHFMFLFFCHCHHNTFHAVSNSTKTVKLVEVSKKRMQQMKEWIVKTDKFSDKDTSLEYEREPAGFSSLFVRKHHILNLLTLHFFHFPLSWTQN